MTHDNILVFTVKVNEKRKANTAVKGVHVYIYYMCVCYTIINVHKYINHNIII